jgi:hypothetical protein
MLCRLSVLAFCGALSLSADVCRSLPTRPPAGSGHSDTPRQISFQLVVKAGGPAFRVTVHGYVFLQGNDPVHAGDIEVARCEDGSGLQVLPIMAYQPIDFGATFDAADVNFDGYLDISVLAEYGGTFGRQVWWLYDPASRKFVKTELTRELDRLRTNGYHLDRKKHEFVAEGLLAGCPSLVTRYGVEGNHLIVVHKETGLQIIENSRRDLPAGVPCTVTVSEMIDGKMRVTAVRRFVDGEPLK